jgi:hypothetical protein
MPGGQAFDRHKRRPPFVRQEQGMRTPVSEGRNPLRPAPFLQVIQQSRETRPFDAQGLTNFRLRPARIGADQNQRGVLSGAHIPRRKRRNEILENQDLQSTQEIAEMPIERVKIELRPSAEGLRSGGNGWF